MANAGFTNEFKIDEATLRLNTNDLCQATISARVSAPTAATFKRDLWRKRFPGVAQPTCTPLALGIKGIRTQENVSVHVRAHPLGNQGA